MIEDVFRFLGTNSIVLGISTLCGVIGFILTIVVTIKTAKINKILKYNRITEQYNSDRLSFQRSFEGYKSSIIIDRIKTEDLQKDILTKVESYKANFSEIISIQEKITLNLFIRILEKDFNEINESDWNKICNYLARLSGRLTKKEEQKNV